MKTSLYTLLIALPLMACSGNNNRHQHDDHANHQHADHSSSQTTSQVTLPDSAQAFIQQYFPNIAVRQVSSKKSPRASGTFFEAELVDGTEIDFGKNGNWIEVKAEEPNHLPTAFFPKAIKDYLEANFAGIGVESIDKEPHGYELELVNDSDLYFDGNGKFLRQKN